MNVGISRRAFLAAGSLAAIGVLGLAGCGKSGLNGKTLYYYSVCGSVALSKVCSNKPGSASTIKFDDDTWHYVGSTELSGDWKAEGDDVVLSSLQLGTVTLVRQDDGSYVPSGSEDYGERYFEDESAAKSYYDEYTAAAPDRVRDTLEGATWSVKDLPSTQTVAETLSFDGSSLVFTKGEYQRTGFYSNAPRESSWLASDHSGEYDLDVSSQWVSSDGSSPRPLIYEGTITVGGEKANFRLSDRKGSLKLTLSSDSSAVTFANGK